jgi:type I restriction enzyme S subunit
MGWDFVPLTSVSTLESGHTPSRSIADYWNGSIPWVSLHDSEGLNASRIVETTYSVSQLGIANSSARVLPAGTVVFSRTATVGKSTILGREMATSQDFANYVCGPRLHNRYLMYLFRFMGPEWNRLMAGSTHNTIYMPVFESLQILLPPLSEQYAIGEVLSDVDNLIEELDGLIAKMQAIKIAAMQQLLTGKTRLPGFGKEWSETVLGDACEVMSGATPSTQVQRNWNGNIPWCTPTDVTGTRGKYLYATERRITTAGLASCGAILLPRGALLLCSRATIGEVKIAATEVCTNQGFKSLVCRPGVSNEFMYYLVLTLKPQMIERAIGSTFLEIGKRDLATIPIRMPDEAEQFAIATVLSDMDSEIEALERRRDKTRAIKQGMMQQLLTGRIRLVEHDKVAV